MAIDKVFLSSTHNKWIILQPVTLPTRPCAGRLHKLSLTTMTSIEMEDLNSKNNHKNLSHFGSRGSSVSGSLSAGSQQTTATSVRGSAHHSAVHMTPVEALDPVTHSTQQQLAAGGDWSGTRMRVEASGTTVFEKVVMAISIVILVLTWPLSLLACFRVVRHYERLIVLRMGRIRQRNPVGPGTIFVIPCVDSAQKVDLRIRSFSIESTDIMLSDSVQVRIEAVVWFRVVCPLSAVVATDDFTKSTHKLTIGMIRRFLGYKTLTSVVSHEREFNQEVKANINQVGTCSLSSR